ncbi:MAG: hypothetical protein IPL88_05780 [Rhizobiales bacterium]|nr:hypothetical protein [Hyphomicrobiales bacterium]
MRHAISDRSSDPSQARDALRRADLAAHLRDYRAFARIVRWAGALWLTALAVLIPFAIH